MEPSNPFNETASSEPLNVAMIGTLPPDEFLSDLLATQEPQSLDEFAAAPVSINTSASPRVFVGTKPKRPQSAKAPAPSTSSVLRPLTAGPSSAEYLPVHPLSSTRRTKKPSTFQLSQPVNDRVIPTYDANKDPHCTRFNGPGSHRPPKQSEMRAARLAQAQALREAASEQKALILSRRNHAYSRTMHEAKRNAAYARYERDESNKFLPPGTWLPLAQPPKGDGALSEDPSPRQSGGRPPPAKAGPTGAPALISGLARGDAKAREAILSQIAFVGDRPSGRGRGGVGGGGGGRGRGGGGRSSYSAPPPSRSTITRPSQAMVPPASGPFNVSGGNRHDDPAVFEAGGGGGRPGGRRGGGGEAVPNDSSVFGTPFVKRVVDMFEHTMAQVSRGAGLHAHSSRMHNTHAGLLLSSY